MPRKVWKRRCITWHCDLLWDSPLKTFIFSLKTSVRRSSGTGNGALGLQWTTSWVLHSFFLCRGTIHPLQKVLMCTNIKLIPLQSQLKIKQNYECLLFYPRWSVYLFASKWVYIGELGGKEEDERVIFLLFFFNF